jgi:hypothetical protein
VRPLLKISLKKLKNTNGKGTQRLGVCDVVAIHIYLERAMLWRWRRAVLLGNTGLMLLYIPGEGHVVEVE